MQDVANIAAPIGLILVLLFGLGRCSIPGRIAIEIPLFLVLAAYLIAVSLANDAIANLSSVEFMARYGKVVYIVGLFIVFYLFKPGCAVERTAYRAAILAALILSAFSLYSYFVSQIVWNDIKFTNENAIQGLFGGKNPMAGCMGTILALLLLSFANRATPFSPLHNPVLITAAAVVIAAAFLFAKSRGYALGILATFGWLALRTALLDWTNYRWSRQTFAYAVVCVGFVAAVLVFGGDRYEEAFENDPNVVTRFDLWDRAAKMFFMSPIIGLGLGTFQAVDTTIESVIPGILAFKTAGYYLPGHIEHDIEGGMHVHNVYLQILVEGGLIGFVLFFAILALLVRRAVVVGRMPVASDDGFLALVQFNAAIVVSMFIYLAMSGVTAGFTFTSPTMSWVFFVAAARLARQHQHLAKMARRTAPAGGAPGSASLTWRART